VNRFIAKFTASGSGVSRYFSHLRFPDDVDVAALGESLADPFFGKETMN